MKGISIIVCTYSPEEEVFSRCLHAIEHLKHPKGVAVQCTIVDNNSKLPVAQLPYVKTILDRNNWMQVLVDKRPGQSNARETGCRASTGDWIVFFDDDNEPSEDYLTTVTEIIKQYPKVGMWGPGKIKVVYMAEVDSWFEKENNKGYFQERDYGKLLIDSNREMQYFYPPGTGMVVRKNILLDWADKFASHVYNVLGRTGGNLGSSDDLQILYTALDSGYEIGSCPTLSLNHLTPPRKSTFLYIKRLAFGIATSGPQMHAEIHHKGDKSYHPDVESKLYVAWRLIIFNLRYLLKSKQHKFNFLLSYISYFGGITGKYRLVNRPLPTSLKNFIQKFELE